MIMMIVLIVVVVIITRAIDNDPAARHGLVMTTILCWWWDAMGWMIRVWMSMATILSLRRYDLVAGCHWDPLKHNDTGTATRQMLPGLRKRLSLQRGKGVR